jgi:hypothetical protein
LCQKCVKSRDEHLRFEKFPGGYNPVKRRRDDMGKERKGRIEGREEGRIERMGRKGKVWEG